MPGSHRPIDERFWEKVDRSSGPNSCWPWTAAMGTTGYGNFRCPYGHKAHRIAYFLANGPIPKGKWVLHTCDNRKCCNPAHLFLGTAKDNTQDMIKKGRRGNPHVESAKSHTAKLTENQVKAIRKEGAKGSLYTVIAKRYGVTAENISMIIRRKTWRHI
jgi:hypothetical protein